MVPDSGSRHASLPPGVENMFESLMLMLMLMLSVKSAVCESKLGKISATDTSSCVDWDTDALVGRVRMGSLEFILLPNVFPT